MTRETETLWSDTIATNGSRYTARATRWYDIWTRGYNGSISVNSGRHGATEYYKGLAEVDNENFVKNKWRELVRAMEIEVMNCQAHNQCYEARRINGGAR